MAHQLQHSHVPKFSNWDSDKISYTAYFDNARKEKAIINPNDPEENPEAFNLYIRRGVEKVEAVKVSTRIHSYSTSCVEQISHEDRRSKANKRHSHHSSSKGTPAESASERRNSDYSVIQREKPDLRKSTSVGGSFIGTFSLTSHNKRIGGSHSLNDHANPQATLIPEFGAWDVTDPKSGEGYTAIFSEIRKEKQSASRHIPSGTPSLNNCSNIQNQCGRPSSILSKCCCCLFSSESK